MNNGFTSNYFNIGFGVRQGALCHAPLLFILSLEVLAFSIRQTKNIQEIKIGNEEVELGRFSADNTLVFFFRNKSSYEHLVCILKIFSVFSGLKVNLEKTEFFYLGLRKLETFLQEFKTSVKIVGVCFSYNEVHMKIFLRRFSNTLRKLTLNRWKNRGLTLRENPNFQISRNPKIMFKATLIYVTNDLVQAVNKRILQLHLERM